MSQPAPDRRVGTPFGAVPNRPVLARKADTTSRSATPRESRNAFALGLDTRHGHALPVRPQDDARSRLGADAPSFGRLHDDRNAMEEPRGRRAAHFHRAGPAAQSRPTRPGSVWPPRRRGCRGRVGTSLSAPCRREARGRVPCGAALHAAWDREAHPQFGAAVRGLPVVEAVGEAADQGQAEPEAGRVVAGSHAAAFVA